jgi:hypothetical protein
MSLKFKYDFKPQQPVEAGYFAFRPALSVAMEIDATKPDALELMAGPRASELKFTAEKKFRDDFSATVGFGFKNEPLDKITNAVKLASREQFGTALQVVLESSLKGKLSSKLPITWEINANLSTTPIYIKLAGKWQSLKFAFSSREYTLAAAFDGGCGFGLTKAGWIAVAKKVGGSGLKTFMSKALPYQAELGAWVAEITLAEVAAGLAVGAAIVGFEALGAYSIGTAHTKGELQGLATWYSTAYCKRLFHPEQKTIEGVVRAENAQLVQDLVQCAWKDVVSDGKKNLKERGLYSDTLSESEILERYRGALIKAEGSAAAAEAKMQPKMRDRAYELLLKKKEGK